MADRVRYLVLLPTIMPLVYVTLGYVVDGQSGLTRHFNEIWANIIPIVCLAVVYVVALIIWYNLTEHEYRTIVVRQVRIR